MSAVLSFIVRLKWELTGIGLALIPIVLYFFYDVDWPLILTFTAFSVYYFVQLFRSYAAEMRERFRKKKSDARR